MVNSVYFAYFADARRAVPSPAVSAASPVPCSPFPVPSLCLGYGFTSDGNFRAPADPAESDGVVLDDRFAPSAAGRSAALRLLGGFAGPIVCDFEGPPREPFAGLIRALADRELILPEAWAALPHRRVLVGRRLPRGPFLPWLNEKKARWGAVVYDAAPLRAALRPGRGWESECSEIEGRKSESSGAEGNKTEGSEAEGSETESRKTEHYNNSMNTNTSCFYSPALGCFCSLRAEPEPTLHFFDTARTLLDRCTRAGVPAILLWDEYRRLADDTASRHQVL